MNFQTFDPNIPWNWLFGLGYNAALCNLSHFWHDIQVDSIIAGSGKKVKYL
jgi:hypothetical protein